MLPHRCPGKCVCHMEKSQYLCGFFLAWQSGGATGAAQNYLFLYYFLLYVFYFLPAPVAPDKKKIEKEKPGNLVFSREIGVHGVKKFRFLDALFLPHAATIDRRGRKEHRNIAGESIKLWRKEHKTLWKGL